MQTYEYDILSKDHRIVSSFEIEANDKEEADVKAEEHFVDFVSGLRVE